MNNIFTCTNTTPTNPCMTNIDIQNTNSTQQNYVMLFSSSCIPKDTNIALTNGEKHIIENKLFDTVNNETISIGEVDAHTTIQLSVQFLLSSSLPDTLQKKSCKISYRIGVKQDQQNNQEKEQYTPEKILGVSSQSAEIALVKQEVLQEKEETYTRPYIHMGIAVIGIILFFLTLFCLHMYKKRFEHSH